MERMLRLRRGVSYHKAAQKASADSRAACSVPWSGRANYMRKLVGLPRDAVPPPVGVAPIEGMSLVPPRDDASGEVSHIDNDGDDGDDDDDHVGDVDTDASQHGEQLASCPARLWQSTRAR